MASSMDVPAGNVGDRKPARIVAVAKYFRNQREMAMVDGNALTPKHRGKFLYIKDVNSEAGLREWESVRDKFLMPILDIGLMSLDIENIYHSNPPACHGVLIGSPDMMTIYFGVSHTQRSQAQEARALPPEIVEAILNNDIMVSGKAIEEDIFRLHINPEHVMWIDTDSILNMQQRYSLGAWDWDKQRTHLGYLNHMIHHKTHPDASYTDYKPRYQTPAQWRKYYGKAYPGLQQPKHWNAQNRQHHMYKWAANLTAWQRVYIYLDGVVPIAAMFRVLEVVIEAHWPVYSNIRPSDFIRLMFRYVKKHELLLTHY